MVVAVVGVVDGGSRGWWWCGLVAVEESGGKHKIGNEILKLKIYKIQKLLDARRCVQYIKIMQGGKIHQYLQYWQATRIRYTKPKKNTKYRKYLIIAILKHFRGFEKNTNILIILGNP